MSATYKSIQNRVDTLGVSEPEIIVEGDKIRVKLAGVTNEKDARERLSTPAVLSFRDTSDNKMMGASILGSPAAKLDYNQNKQPVVGLSVKDKDKFYAATKKISTRDDQLMVIWLDFDEENDSYEKSKETCGQDGNMSCISAATVKEAFASDVIIQGGFTRDEAQELVDLAIDKGTPVLRDAAEEVRLKAIEVTKDVLKKLEKEEKK